MAYQVLARKWRPQDFESVVGQGPVVQALRNGLTDGRIAQAYLFSGIRGVGKTSVARVLAKALNCEKGPAGDPCNDCDACRDITAGSDLDVLEIDAATYSKVEQVRELTDSLQYGPARDKYKVVIIDEIHRLSRQAFDALLKIVEEPPPHLVFIFATTENEAVPATILSRCQTFQFGRVPLVEMVAHLQRISAEEEFEVSEHGLHLIARASEGSVRDGVALLDQLATFGGGTIADDEVGRILGGVDLSLFLDLIRSISGGDRQQVSAFVGHVEEHGWDPRHVYGEFLAYCRDALHLALDPVNARVDLPSEEAAALQKHAQETGYENLLRLLNLLLTSEMTVRRSESAGLALEIALLRAAEIPRLTAIEDILSGGGGSTSAGPDSDGRTGTTSGGATGGRQATAPEPAAAPAIDESGSAEPAVATAPEAELEESKPSPPDPVAPQPPARSESSSKPTDPQPAGPEAAGPEPAGSEHTASEPPLPEPPPEIEPDMGFGAVEPPFEPHHQPGPSEFVGQPPENGGPTNGGSPENGATANEAVANKDEPLRLPRIEEGEKTVNQLIERISYLKQSLAAHITGAACLACADNVFIITTEPGDAVLEKTLLRKSNKQMLDEVLAEMLGPEASWRVRAGKGRPRQAEEADDAGPTREEVAAADPTVQSVLDLFGGQIQNVEPIEEPPDKQGAS